jgi:cell division protein FtsB
MKNLPFSFRRIAVFVGIFILILVVIEFNTRLEELNRLNDQLEEVRTSATQAMQTQVSLQTQVAFAESTAAVDEWARREGHYVKDGDQPVVSIGQPGSEPLIAATPTPMPTPMENWQVWWKLFFAKK